MQRIVILVVHKACFHKSLLFAWGKGEWLYTLVITDERYALWTIQSRRIAFCDSLWPCIQGTESSHSFKRLETTLPATTAIVSVRFWPLEIYSSFSTCSCQIFFSSHNQCLWSKLFFKTFISLLTLAQQAEFLRFKNGRVFGHKRETEGAGDILTLWRGSMKIFSFRCFFCSRFCCQFCDWR